MAYQESGGTLKYFTPKAGLAAGAITVLEELDIGASSGDHGEVICVKPCTIKRLWFMPVTEAASGTVTAPTVVFTKRPTPGSATGESAAGTLTIPSGTAIGTPVYKDVNVQMEPGDALEISWTVGVGTPTGKGHWWLEAYDTPEDSRNVSNAVKSA